jgi:hypothetical protein
MPRRAIRRTPEITDVRAQRLHDISDDDAKAEAIGERPAPMPGWHWEPFSGDFPYWPCKTPAIAYQALREQINGRECWTPIYTHGR